MQQLPKDNGPARCIKQENFIINISLQLSLKAIVKNLKNWIRNLKRINFAEQKILNIQGKTNY